MTDIENNWGDGMKMYMKNYTIYDWDLKFPPTGSFCRAAVPSQPNYPFFVYENIIDPEGNKPFDNYDCSRVGNFTKHYFNWKDLHSCKMIDKSLYVALIA